MEDGQSVPPPSGFVGFCMRTPQACTHRDGATRRTVILDRRTVAVLVAVNESVNRKIRYETDQEHYGVANRWTLYPSDEAGDCKAYALAKREALRDYGLPDAAKLNSAAE